MNTSRDYFGIHRIVSLVLLIFPLTAWVLGVATRLSEKKYVAAIVRIIIGWNGWNILWICDIISSVINGCRVKVCRFIDI